MLLIRSSVGRKIIMAVTGQLMVLFVILHVAGNMTIYFDLINAYAEKLHAFPPIVWSYRIIMITVVLTHIVFGLILKIENLLSNPHGYVIKQSIRKTFASETMIWSGAFIALFIVYHLFHFTVQSINPELSARLNTDAMGRPDVMNMLVGNFQIASIGLFYVSGMIALLLHLSHGVQSSFQTLGLNSEKSIPIIVKAGKLAAFLIFVAYVSIPILIMVGLMDL
ncbi:MAG: succinate dehydrogenase cytochrome b subunit [Nitrospirota bacterium]|nr:MAG: succinate dehydrogenase cytochrome b subunit [Nitrospirota bacterium]